MKGKIRNWFKGHRALRVLLPGAISLLLVGAVLIPYAQADITYLDLEGTYTVYGTMRAKYLDGSAHPNLTFGTLTITTQTNQVISSASLATFGEDLALTGIVGSGSRPWISLKGDDGNDTYVTINGRVTSKGGVVTGITGGAINGFIISDGHKWDDSADGTAATSTVAANSGAYSALLTAGTLANPEAVIFHSPINRFKLSQMDTLADSSHDGISFYFNLQNTKGPGPQIMLRFAPVGSTTQSYYGGGTSGLVDITIMPYQAPYVGDGTWKKCTITKDSAICGYYGDDPTDYTSFDGGWAGENYTLAEVEAAINAEAAMIAGGDSASNWVLTMVDIELWEGGARTCYVDNVQIGRYTYTLEPTEFSGAFRAKKN